MKRLLLSAIYIVIALSLYAQTDTYIEWKFSSEHADRYIETGIYPASTGSGNIRFIGNRATPTVVGKRRYNPAAEGTRKGDYWLMTIPVEEVKAGTVIDIWIPFLTSPSEQPHNFVLEYRDGKRWCAAMTTERGGANCQSTISKSRPRFLWQSVRLENGIKKGELQVRLRQCDMEATSSRLYGGRNGDAPTLTSLLKMAHTHRMQHRTLQRQYHTL